MKSFTSLGKKEGGCIEGYQMKFITPYMHIMVFHVPTMFDLLKNLKMFTGQGEYYSHICPFLYDISRPVALVCVFLVTTIHDLFVCGCVFFK